MYLRRQTPATFLSLSARQEQKHSNISTASIARIAGLISGTTRLAKMAGTFGLALFSVSPSISPHPHSGETYARARARDDATHSAPTTHPPDHQRLYETIHFAGGVGRLTKFKNGYSQKWAGGIRIKKYKSAADADVESRELAMCMEAKNRKAGIGCFGGCKTVINIDPTDDVARDKALRELAAVLKETGGSVLVGGDLSAFSSLTTRVNYRPQLNLNPSSFRLRRKGPPLPQGSPRGRRTAMRARSLWSRDQRVDWTRDIRACWVGGWSGVQRGARNKLTLLPLMPTRTRIRTPPPLPIHTPPPHDRAGSSPPRPKRSSFKAWAQLEALCCDCSAREASR